jgi:hypothetical protein
MVIISYGEAAKLRGLSKGCLEPLHRRCACELLENFKTPAAAQFGLGRLADR